MNDGLTHLALPKGRMQDNVMRLMGDAGIKITFDRRGYRPSLSLDGFEAKILKPQNIVEMLDHGSRDVGFAGADWVYEKNVELVELLDTGMDPVKIVAAGDAGFMERGGFAIDGFVVATEYIRVTQDWLTRHGYNAQIVRAYGATEVFPPEDADCIVDNTATGATLRANGLVIAEEVMRSSTRLFACPRSMDDPAKRDRIEHLVMLLKSVLDARLRVMLELNVAADHLEEVVKVLPGMREPTISSLHAGNGFAVKAAVPRDGLPALIARIKMRGGTDILVSNFAQIIP